MSEAGPVHRTPRAPCRWGILSTVVVAVAGCRDARETTPVPETPTFSANVAAILYDRCAGCHRPDGPAPFPLLTYDDARPYAPAVAAAVRARRMPPWQPEPTDYEFADERRLTEREIVTLERWAAQGAPAGDLAAAPAPPPPASDWPLGEPDLVVAMPEHYPVTAEAGEVFRNFVLPVPIDSPRYVRAVDMLPGDARLVHHAVMSVDPSPLSRQEDALDEEAGFDGMLSRGGGRPPGGFFVGWTPGRITRPNPDGLAWRLEPGTDVVLQMHLRPHAAASATTLGPAYGAAPGATSGAAHGATSGAPLGATSGTTSGPAAAAASAAASGAASLSASGTTAPAAVQARLGFYFTDRPPERAPTLVRLGGQAIDIPAGVADYVVADSFTLPVDIEALSLYPHAHYLATVMDVRAVLPDGTERRLLRIDDWDFNWQDAYTFREPVALPAGTTLRLRYVYDNSAANPQNPNRPPRRVVYGPGSTDEMAELWIQALPRTTVDLVVLQREVARKQLRDRIEGWSHLVALDPSDGLAHLNLAAYLAMAGQAERAISHYRQAIATAGNHPSAHYNLAILLEARGDTTDAIAQYREAIRVRPEHAGAHNNLGGLLAARGQRDDAATHYRAAIALEPDRAEARNNLGRLLWENGAPDEAVALYRAARDAEPNAVAPRFNLAFALAALGRPDEALAEFAHAVRLEPSSVEAHLTMAWVLATHPDATARRPEQALALVERAAALYRQPHPRILDVQAAAHAAAGRFDIAVRVATEATRMAETAGARDLAAPIRARLDGYRSRRPYIEDPRANTVRPNGGNR
jgi:tetratricopeptide (TPR) repeat protein